MTPSQLMGRLRAACLPRLVAYETDLGHDADWIDANPGHHFIHTCRTTGTNIWPCPMGYGSNEREPYLFGESTPQEQAHGIVAVLKAQATDSIFHYFDGRRLRLVTPEAALVIYRDYLRRSDELLNKQRRAG